MGGGEGEGLMLGVEEWEGELGMRGVWNMEVRRACERSSSDVRSYID